MSFPLPLVAADASVWLPAFLMASFLRLEIDTVVSIDWPQLIFLALGAAAVHLTCCWSLGIYSNRWRISSFEEAIAVGICWTTATGVAFISNRLLFTPRTPTSIAGLGAVGALLSMMVLRMAWRLAREASQRPDPEGRQRVLVFGAGEAGRSVVAAMMTDPQSEYIPVAVLDDAMTLQGRRINGVKVQGTRERIEHYRRHADVFLIAVPSANAELIEDLSRRGRDAGLDVRILPSTEELFGMLATIEAARPLSITDLMGRQEVGIDRASVEATVQGKVVLVTGAGGSIGSELCRQLAEYNPLELVMVDRDETALQALQISMTGRGLLDDHNLVLADIRDRDRMLQLFADRRPDVVFHAAALKHLPLLEAHPREALLTNVLGTRNVLGAAAAVGVKHFVNVSTDKAANPTSVLGTTKRLAEALTLWFGKDAPGEYLSVRFGNVLGSRGSVLPLFERQIAAGGPLTVTHPEVTRFFMSIPEASRLVLQAGAIGKTGETLVLDMGEPVKIVDLAEMLLLHHRSDAKIEFTGLRPNEKLHEVLGHDGEVMATREHDRILHTSASVLTEDLDWIDSLLDLDQDALAQALMWRSEAISQTAPIDSAN